MHLVSVLPATGASCRQMSPVCVCVCVCMCVCVYVCECVCARVYV